MGRYAEKTTVSAQKSMDDIERALKRYNCTQFATGRNFEQAFMTDILLPGNQTIRQYLGEQIIRSIEQGTLPKALPMLD